MAFLFENKRVARRFGAVDTLSTAEGIVQAPLSTGTRTATFRLIASGHSWSAKYPVTYKLPPGAQAVSVVALDKQNVKFNFTQSGDTITLPYPTGGANFSQAIVAYRVPITYATRQPPASYPIKNPVGTEPLDPYLPPVQLGKRYGGLSAGGNGMWDWLSWRKYKLWGTGEDPGNRIEARQLLTPKEQSYFSADAVHGETWLQKNPIAPAIVLGVVGGGLAVAGASGLLGGGAAVSSGGTAAAGGTTVLGGVATATPAVVTTAPSLATMAGAGSMVGGFGAGIGGAAAVVPSSLASIVGASAAAASIVPTAVGGGALSSGGLGTTVTAGGDGAGEEGGKPLLGKVMQATGLFGTTPTATPATVTQPTATMPTQPGIDPKLLFLGGAAALIFFL